MPPCFKKFYITRGIPLFFNFSFINILISFKENKNSLSFLICSGESLDVCFKGSLISEDISTMPSLENSDRLILKALHKYPIIEIIGCFIPLSMSYKFDCPIFANLANLYWSILYLFLSSLILFPTSISSLLLFYCYFNNSKRFVK